jgi:hypothetical protein
MKYIYDKSRIEGRGRSRWRVKNPRRLVVYAGEIASLKAGREDMRQGRVIKFCDAEDEDAPLIDGEPCTVMMSSSAYEDFAEILGEKTRPSNWAEDPRRYKPWR